MQLPALAITLAINMSKAFNTVNIHKFINKLIHTNIPNITTGFIANYIRICKAYTIFRDQTSLQCQLKTGIPHLGILLATFFTIYTTVRCEEYLKNIFLKFFVSILGEDCCVRYIKSYLKNNLPLLPEEGHT